MKKERQIYHAKRSSIKEPADFSIRSFSCYDFLESTRLLIDENFSGAIELVFPEHCKGAISISPRGFAYFVRLLLSEIYGNSLAYAKIEYTEKEICVFVTKEDGLSCIDKLADAAARSGFSVTHDSKSITLRCEADQTSDLAVFAHGALVFINYYLETLLC